MTERRRDDAGWRMVWVLAVTCTVSYGVLLYAFSVFLTPMRHDLHASVGALSGAVSLSIAVAGLLALPVGAWLDRHGARALMTVGSIVAGAAVLGWSQSRNMPELYASFVGVGIASAALFYDPAFAVINTWFDRDRHAALLTLTVVAGFASTVFLPTSQGLTQALGWRNALVVLALLCLATAVPHALVLRRHPSAHVGEGRVRFNDPDLRTALSHASVRWLTASTVLLTAGVTMVIVYLVTYLRSRGYSATDAAFGAGAIGVMSVSGRIAFTRLVRRLRLARVAAGMLVGQIVGIAALEWVPRPAGLILFVLSFGSAFGVMTIARPALLGLYVAPQVFARVSGVQGLVTDVGRIAAPIVAGALITWTNGYGAMLAAVAVCSALAAATLHLADEAASDRHTSRVVEVHKEDVEQAFGRAVATYDVTPLDPHLRLHSVTGGVFLVTADGDEAVLKVVRHGVDDDPGALWVAGGDVAHRNYWKREWLAFDSGLLAGLPPGVAAPRSLATTQPRDDECWIWMEAAHGRTAEAIRLDEYAAIAEALGRTQGWFAADRSRLPSYEWLSRDWLRGWAETSAGQLANVRGEEGWDDARLAPLLPWRQRSLDVWAQRDALLHILETAPQTVVHLDFWPHNLFITDDNRVVAIDWSQVGIGGLAQDLDQITLDTVWMHVQPDADLAQLEDAVLPAYASGLRTAGFDVSDAALKLWYAAAAAVKYVPLLELQVTQVRDPEAVARAEQRFGRPFADVTATKSRVVRRAVELGEWALGSAS